MAQRSEGPALRPAVFVDRDGTLIEEVNWLRDRSQVTLVPGAAEAIRRLRAAGWVVVLVTNQSVVARGLLDEAGLAEIHGHLRTLLSQVGAQLDGIYYCPHHPGPLPGATRSDLIRLCDCRKPATGMLKQAAADLGLDLGQSWFVGDTTGDIQTARNAGLRSALVLTGHGGRDGLYDAKPTLTVASLTEAVGAIGLASLYRDSGAGDDLAGDMSADG